MNKEALLKAAEILETTTIEQGHGGLFQLREDGELCGACAQGVLGIELLGIDPANNDANGTITKPLSEYFGVSLEWMLVHANIVHWNDTCNLNFQQIARRIREAVAAQEEEQ